MHFLIGEGKLGQNDSFPGHGDKLFISGTIQEKSGRLALCVPVNNTEKKQKEDTSIYIEDNMDVEIEMKKLGKPSIDNY